MEDRVVVVNLVWLDPKDWVVVESSAFFSAIPWQARANLIVFNNLTERAVLQSSYMAESGWITIGVFEANTASYLDISANNTLYLNGMLHYRILYPESKRKTQIVKVQEHSNKVATEISRRHRIALSKGLNGELGYTFIKHRDGIRCSNCWDDILQQRILNDCDMCLNTGWEYGYYSPIETYFNSSPNISSIQPSLEGTTSAGNTQTAWISNYPLVSTGDILISTDDWSIWAIESSQQSFHKGILTKQSLNLSIIQGNDPRKKLLERIRSEL